MEKGKINTLEYNPGLCNRCGICSIVCPHRVFAAGEESALLVDMDSCMECGACQLNCATGAIRVDSNVGCASAMMKAALKRRKSPATCCA
jgi:NAD-dependent dihydropyrimidine dehydrogenase PreA subunit